MLNKELLMMSRSVKQNITVTVSYYAMRITDPPFRISNADTYEVYYEDWTVPNDVNTISINVPSNTSLKMETGLCAMYLLRIEPSDIHYEIRNSSIIVVYTENLDCTIDIEISR